VLPRQPKGYVQFWELLKRQVTVYLRNPIMSTSRFIAGVCTALFFGGAFWQLGRNAGGYDARCAEGFAYKLMVPGYGSAAIAYWVEKRKAFYHEEAAGYYHRLYHLIVMYFVEWVFVSAVMVGFRCFAIGHLASKSYHAPSRQAVVGGIMFPMSGWRADKIGNYIGYMVCEAFSSTGLNLVCAYIAASIPYANATFTLHYFYGILLVGFWSPGNWEARIKLMTLAF
jgi:hypothetical protein